MKNGNGVEVTLVQPAVLPISEARPLATRALEAAHAVQRELGPGLEALFYARALALELQARGIAYRREVWIDLRFRGTSLGRRRLSFLLDDLAIEIASAEHIEPRDLQRLRAMVHSAGVAAGMFVNFGVVPLDVRHAQNEPTTLR